MPTTQLTSLRDALLLLAHAPGDPDYLALYDAVAAVAIARTQREISELEYVETLERIATQLRDVAGACDRLIAADDELTRAETAQRLVEIRTGVGA